MAQTVLPLNPLTAWDSRLARPGLHTTVQHKAMLSPQNLRRALCQARSTIRRRVDSAPAYPCTTNAGRNGRKGSPQSYERCQPPYTSTDGSEDPPLFSLESRTVSFSAEKEMVLALRRSRKSVPAGRRTTRGPFPPFSEKKVAFSPGTGYNNTLPFFHLLFAARGRVF